MKPPVFDYRAPTTVAEAVRLLADLGDEAKVLAGGQSLIPMLNMRLAAPEYLVDVGRVAELKGVEARPGAVRIGAGTTEAAVGRDPDVAAGVPLLTQATPMIGHFQLRNRGTLGGSVAHADPAAEYQAVALALDAEMEVVSVRGQRTIAAADYFAGFWTTTME
nr:FAD binding domain-containing protein [Micromonospora sp. DSM 115978]